MHKGSAFFVLSSFFVLLFSFVGGLVNFSHVQGIVIDTMDIQVIILLPNNAGSLD